MGFSKKWSLQDENMPGMWGLLDSWRCTARQYRRRFGLGHTNVHQGREKSEPVLTIFASAKPFHGHTGVIQRNAIASWTRLRPRPEIILFGNEPGVAEI